MAYPRIQPAVEHIHSQIDPDETQSEDEDTRLHYRVVPRKDGLHCQTTDPRPREDNLCDNRATQQRPELDADQGGNRNGGILERVA